jgi:hypothetical protein
MLDENLPAFFLKPSTTGVKHHRDFFLSHRGSDPAPSYALRNADPANPSPQHKNCYGAALYDAYNPEILFGEVVARPTWTQPTLSADEIRKNGGIAPPPQPVLPRDFSIQLYNPDQQVRIDVKEGKWGASDSYEFSLPQSTFRTPSASYLDRGQSDPASLAITPKIYFVWRKESKLNKDLICYMVGKSTDTETKKKSKKDPDIAIALWRNMRELTVYDPNLQRLELEDPKGVEVVLLLSAVVLKDLYFAGKDGLREAFNITDAPQQRKLSGGGRKLSNPNRMSHAISIVGNPALNFHPPSPYHSSQAGYDEKRNHIPKPSTAPPAPQRQRQQVPDNRPPPALADPRSQWELEAETARLKAQAEAEAREERRKRKEREKAEEAERRRLQRMVEEEERAARKKQAEIEKETERLRKVYGVPPVPPRGPTPTSSNPRPSNSKPTRPAASSSRPARQGPFLQPIPQGRPAPRPAMGSNGMYRHPAASASAMMSGANANASQLSLAKPLKKKSIFGLRSSSDESGDRLKKKGSAMW